MHLLLLTAYFPPDGGSASHLFYELGQTLLQRGHQVTVVTGFPGYHASGEEARYQHKWWVQENVDGLSVYRIAVPQLARNTPMGRGLWQFSCAFMFTLAAFLIKRADVSLVYSPPLPLALTALVLRLVRQIPTVINVQDLFPQSAIDLGLLHQRPLIACFNRMEQLVYHQANAITVHSTGNLAHILQKGGEANRTFMVHNAVDIARIQPQPSDNKLRRDLGLSEHFVLSFAGVMGYSQDIDIILAAADQLRHLEKIHFLLVGDGVEKDRLMTKSQKMSLPNITWLPMQPRQVYPAILAASDVGLTTLKCKVKTPVVPSKILNIMAAGRPVVAALNLQGDAPALITEAQAGVCVPAEDAAALTKAILSLYGDVKLCHTLGLNGRRYAEKHLSSEAISRQYEAIFKQVTTASNKVSSNQKNVEVE